MKPQMTGTDLIAKERKEQIEKELYSKLASDKIKINWNKRPINMSVFLSFITIDAKRSYDHLGHINGWTRLENSESGLIICGGMVGGVELLDSLQYGKKIMNQYNNYVNPFYLFDILNDDGKRFFIDYYKEDMNKLLQDHKYKVEQLQNKLISEKQLTALIAAEIDRLNAVQNKEG